MNDKVTVFGQRRAGVYLLSEIYDPAKTNSSVQNVGKVIPAVGSIVVDDSVTEHNTLYVVYSVDAVTFKCTLVPAITNVSDLGDDQIITYGNNIYMLYYQKKDISLYNLTDDTVFLASKNYYTRSGTSPNYVYTRASVVPGVTIPASTYYEKITKHLWELDVDNKISIFGDRARSYTLYKGSSLTAQDLLPVVSHYYIDEDGYLVENNRIPMEQLSVPVVDGTGTDTTAIARKPIISYSATEIVDDETYVFAVYDENNRLIAQITLIAHAVLGLSALASTQFPIERFYVAANQYIQSEGKCYLYRGQNVDELIFYPHIEYANGDSIADAAIDNTQLFIYGKDTISTAVAGNEYTVLFKYFLGNNESTAADHTYGIGASGRYIYTTAKVKILDSVSTSISKISPIVVYDSTNKYRILPVMYFRERQEPQVLPEGWEASSFDGTVYETAQTLKIRATEQSSTYNTTDFYQSFIMTVRNPDDPERAGADGVFFYYKDDPSTTDNYYGKNYTDAPRPVINHDIVNSNVLVVSLAGISDVNGSYSKTGIKTINEQYDVYRNGNYWLAASLFDNNVYWVFSATTPGPNGCTDPGVQTYQSRQAITSDQSPVGLEYEVPTSHSTIGAPTVAAETPTHKYYIPSNVFLNVTQFLNSFYYKADPPMINELTPVTPTHFIVRQVDFANRTIYTATSAPVAIENYAIDLSITRTLGSTTQYQGTCIVEFLYHEDGASTYDYLFGVPVDVITKNVTPSIGTYRGPLYCIRNSEELTFQYSGDSLATNLNRQWTCGTYVIKGVQTGTDHFKWQMYNGSSAMSDAASSTTPIDLNYYDPAEVNWNGSSVSYMSKIAPPKITVTTPVTISANQGDSFSLQLAGTCDDGQTCTFSSASLPAGVICTSTGIVQGSVATQGTYVGYVTVSCGLAVPKVITVNFTIIKTSTYAGYIYAKFGSHQMSCFTYEGPVTPLNANRKWGAVYGNNVYTIQPLVHTVTEEGTQISKLVWAITVNYGNPSSEEVFYSNENLNDDPTIDPYGATWDTTSVTYMSTTSPAQGTTRATIYVTIDGYQLPFLYNEIEAPGAVNTLRKWKYTGATDDQTKYMFSESAGSNIYRWKIYGSEEILSTTILSTLSSEDPTQVSWPDRVQRISYEP